MTKNDRCLVAALALGLDAGWGDPSNRFHPVAWMGNLIAGVERFVPASEGARLCFGGLISLGGAAGCYGVGWLFERALCALPRSTGLLFQAYLLKLVISARGLRLAATEIEAALQEGELSEARRLLGWHLVSRDTQSLSAAEVCAAAIESVAENTSDGVIGPLYYYLSGGLGAAYAYRFSNTVDSMWGYRDPAYEWLGKIPARWDDVLNLIPARLTAGGLWVAGLWTGKDARNGLHIWRKDHRLTESPNAGHPMSMMAGLLQVELEKKGHYRLGEGQRSASPQDIASSVQIMRRGVWIVLGLMAGTALLLSGCRRFWLRKTGAR